MEIPWDYILRIVAAFAAGAILGLEREYRSKPAGLRTIILITVGSALFALLNLTLSSVSPDRIASAVVTGIGFLGAGVIFKEGLNVRGLTTAATIWVAAAIGMALGFGEYMLATATLVLVLVTLVILTKLELWLSVKERREYAFSFFLHEYSAGQLEDILSEFGIDFEQTHFSKRERKITVHYKFAIDRKHYKALLNTVIHTPSIISFFRL